MLPLDRIGQAPAHFPAGAEHTSDSASGPHVSGALSCPNSVQVSGWQGRTLARRVARRYPCVQPLPAHPVLLNTAPDGPPKLIVEPETMTTQNAGKRPASAPKGQTPPPQFLRRLARRIVLRAALRGRLSWHVALPALQRIDGQEV